MSGPTWSAGVTIPNGSYEISQIQNYFVDEVIKKHESNVKSNEQSPILIYVNRILNRVSFRIKTGYKLELLTNETMRLLGDGPIINTIKNGENVPRLEIVRNVLVFCNLVENVYLQDSELLFSFVPNSRFGSLLSITPQVLKYCDTVDSSFNNNKKSICLNYKNMTYSKDNQIRKYVKAYGFMSFAMNFGSEYGKEFLNKGISSSKRIKNTASKFNQSKYGEILKIKEVNLKNSR